MLISISPLVLFVIIDAKSGLKSGLYASVITTIVLGLFLFLYLGYFDWEVVLTLVSVTVFGLFALKKDDKRLFRISPAVTSVSLALLMIVYRMTDKSLVVNLINKLVASTPDFQKPELAPFIGDTQMILQFETGLILATLLHGLAVGYYGWWGSNNSWIVAKAIGYVVVPIVAVMYVLVA